MEQSKKTVDVFIVNGKEFTEKSEARLYELELKERLLYTYFKVVCEPDLTEGRGHYNTIIVARKKGWIKNSVLQYLINRFGNPIVYVQGNASIDNWILDEGKQFKTIEELDSYLSVKVRIGLGDYAEWKSPEVVYIGERGQEVKQNFTSISID